MKELILAFQSCYFLLYTYYLAAPRPSLSHCGGDSLTKPMYITYQSLIACVPINIFDPKDTRRLVTSWSPNSAQAPSGI